MESENFYIRAFDNVFVMDPNKIINSEGFPEERNVSQENLVMYANLECNQQPRSRLVSGQNKQTLENVSIASVNFLKPNNQNFLTTNWTELQSEVSDPNIINSELLGITNITYKCGASYVPTVNITLEDIRGRALFESGNNSVYSVFLNLPYPTFYLTLKGYYGKAVRYTLILQKFQASFDQSTGNFISTLNFVGYKFNLLTDLQQGFLLGLPYMYPQQVNENLQTETSSQQQASVTQLNGDNTDVVSFISNRGYKTIQSVYDLYKSKKIVSEDFPTLTIDQLVSRLQSFEKNILENYGEIDVAKLTDGEIFDGNLGNFLQDVFSAVSPPSWFKKHIDDKKFFMVSGIDGKPYKIYTYTKTVIDNKSYDNVLTELRALIKKNNEIIKNSPTFGEKEGKRDDVISVNVRESNIAPFPYILPNVGSIDLVETAKLRFGKNVPTNSDYNQIKIELENLNNIRNIVIDERNQNDQITQENKEIPFFFRFDGEGYFRDEIFKYKKTLNRKLTSIEENLTAELNNLLKSDKGIGFEPTIRNILAVIFASTDAFLRIMDDVHKKAFDVRDDNRKKRAVIEDVKDDPNSPVYPWPMYAKEIPVDGETKFELKYPGDPDYIFETGAYDYSVWPEVEFVEEFQKGFLQRLQDSLKPNPSDQTEINRLLISAFDVGSNQSYSNLQTIPFLTEIYERLRTISMYQGFERGGGEVYDQILNFISAFEATNIKLGIGKNSDELIDILKNYGFTEPTLRLYLQENAPKTFFEVSAGTIYTPYLRSEISASSKFLEGELPPVSASIATENNANEVEETMTKYLQDNNKNNLYFTDTIPYTDVAWNKNNLSNGEKNSELNKVLSTSKSLFYSTKFKKIVNYQSDYTLDNKGDNTRNRPFNFFVNISSSKIDFVNLTNDMFNYLTNRASNDNAKFSFFTEGKISDLDTNTEVGNNGRLLFKTTSMLNTPMFINALQNGVQADRTGSSFPFVQAGYLFLNSLPLANLKRQYIDFDESEKNYIGPTFKKYGAIHSMPRMWFCKLGSIWYRYKNYVENGSDFLDSALIPFNQNYNYDPINSQPNTTYSLSSSTKNFNIILTDVQTIPSTPSPIYDDIMTVGFYPNLLNDFYYFFNGENLYSNPTNIQQEIQNRIDKKEIILVSNSNSSFFKETNYDPDRPNHVLHYSTISVLFKKTLKDNVDDPSNYYYSAPSFGSRYTQVLTECFGQNILEYPVFGNQNIYNGSVRLFWGGTHFGYCPTVNYISDADEYISRTNENSWPFDLNLDINGENITLDKIEDLFGVFTKEELDLFESEFLNFCRSEQQTTDIFNIQTILKKSLFVEESAFLSTEENLLIENFQKNQLLNFNGAINSYINYNKIYQKGNPTNFDYRTFSYFTNNPLIGVEKPEGYDSTTPNAVPTSAQTTTFSESFVNYPESWISLLLNVGFSTIERVSYDGNTSTITDFFPDNNIAFTTENIERFAGIIKIYASRKLENPNYNNAQFREDITLFIENLLTFRNYIFQQVFTKIGASLTEIKVSRENLDDSKVQGTTSKLEYYNLFKAINDKWIAGNNYNDETMFEDILLIDRANRDIGNKVIVDIFKVIGYLKNNVKSSVYNIVSSILLDNHFQIFNMPSYINFYGCQNVDDTPQSKNDIDFARDLFGTFTDVDYQKSKTKMVCQYVEQPSEQTDNPNIKNGYKNDSWDFEQSPKHPLVEGKQIKNDFGLSNKAVAFSVDFGVQNQGVFTNVQVGQDIGKPTSESLQAEYELANLSRGTNSMSQNVSLINIYKTRSYSSTVTSMGNAMIQPTMYFVLRSIPLFAGPYLITEVEHTITSSDFKTKMVGTRQKIYTPPIKNPLLETIRKNFVTKLKNDLKSKRQAQKVEANTIQTKNNIANTINNKETPSPNQICKTNNTYSDYTTVNVVQTNTATRNMLESVRDKIRAINNGTTDGDVMNYVVVTLFYIESFDGQSFKYYNNNASQIPIGSGTTAWGGNLPTLFNKEYICLNNSQNLSDAYAVFPNLDNCIEFNYSKYKDVFEANLLNIDNESVFVSGFTQTWIEKFPQDNTVKTSNIYQNFVTSYPNELIKLQDKIRASYKLVRAFLDS
jgi:hypothetical protein